MAAAEGLQSQVPLPVPCAPASDWQLLLLLLLPPPLVCCSWIDNVFIPAVNRCGDDGWDIVKVLRNIKAQADMEGSKVGQVQRLDASSGRRAAPCPAEDDGPASPAAAVAVMLAIRARS